MLVKHLLRTQKRINYVRKRTYLDPLTYVDPVTLISMKTIAMGSMALLLGVSSTRYRVSKADELVVKTGLGVKDVQVSKNTFQFPFQTYKKINLQPKNYTFHLSTMSKEKLDFILVI